MTYSNLNSDPKPILDKMDKKSTGLAIAGIVISILIAGGLFYWYEWRPAKIRHDCSWGRNVGVGGDIWWGPANKYEYDFCIHEKGL